MAGSRNRPSSYDGRGRLNKRRIKPLRSTADRPLQATQVPPVSPTLTPPATPFAGFCLFLLIPHFRRSEPHTCDEGPLADFEFFPGGRWATLWTAGGLGPMTDGQLWRR